MMYRRILTPTPAFMVLMSLALFPTLVMGAAVMQMVQMRFFPIIDLFEVERASVDADGSFVISGVLRKRLEGCKYQAASWLAVQRDGVIERLEWSAAERGRPGNNPNRPAGLQEFGPWTVKAGGVDSDEYYLVVDHQCYSLWPTRTKVGPLTAEDLGGKVSSP